MPREGTRRAVLKAGATMAVLGPLAMPGRAGRASAQTPQAPQPPLYPSKPIRIIVPFAPGGSVDVLARAVGQKLTERWGQPVIVESRPGASTMIGTATAAQAEPDGYTLVIVVSNHATNPSLMSKISYDAIRSFTPITMMARTPIVLYANPGLDAKDVPSLAALSHRRPGSMSFGSAGIGSMTHLTGEMLKTEARIDMNHIVYKGGTPAVIDTMGGQIPMTFATVGQALPQYREGKLKAIGISSSRRYASVPEIPTFTEQGTALVTTEWYGLLAPAGVPEPVVAKLQQTVGEILQRPDLGERLTAIELAGSTPAELQAFIQSEIDRWGPVIRRLGLKSG